MDHRAGYGGGYSKLGRRMVRCGRSRRGGGYRPGTQTLMDPPFTDERVFDYSIKGQDGRRFWGEIRSGDRTEPLAGALSLDGKTAYGADTDGHFHFTVPSANEMELCYTQAAIGPDHQIVATCFLIKRK
jgi:hypothetical protein